MTSSGRAMDEGESRFHHARTDYPESAWLARPDWETLPVLDLAALAAAHPAVAVLSAHPDDETLGVGALIAALGRLGVDVDVIVATSGEGSHPAATAWTPADLAAQRRDEVERAVADLDPRARVHHLGLPDGSLADHETALAARVASIISPAALVLAPWVADGHPDHDALGRAARTVADRVGGAVLHYPIWLWHWCPPQEAPWDAMVLVEPEIADLERKRHAMRRFTSQTEPLGPGPGDRPVVTETLQSRAERVVEVLLRADDHLPLAYAESSASARTATFDAMYDRGDDPWDFTDSFYEQRKRDLTLAVLGREHYPRVLEVGCATGQLTAALAGRAGQVTAVDTSARALAVARRRLGDATAPIDWVCGHAPAALPAGPFDLVVLAEVGYFLTPRELLATLQRLRAALAPGGEIVLAHWQHPTSGIPLNGSLVHTQACHAFDLQRRVRYADADLRIDVWGSPASVARVEGRG